METLNYETWDVFTNRPFAGNQLAIVDGADHLNDAQMQAMAREFNLPETIFVMAPRDPANAARVRIFLPLAELPFAGHPVIGCAHWLAARRGLDQLVLETEAGPTPITFGDGLAEFTAPALPVPHGGQVDADRCAAALGLQTAQIGPHAPGTFIGGPSFLFVPVRDRATLRAARPTMPHWESVLAAAGTNKCYVYTPDFHARMFAPDDGVPEDPATGSASAILAGQLLANGALGEGDTALTLHQGVDMGRASRIGLSATVTGGTLDAVRIAGAAVPIASGKVRVPD